MKSNQKPKYQFIGKGSDIVKEMKSQPPQDWEKEWEEFEISLIKIIGAVKSDNVIQDHLSRVRKAKDFIRQLLLSQKETSYQEGYNVEGQI